MDAFVTSLIDFVSANRDWAFWIALLFAAAETTAFISIAIPSTAILIGVGALVATGGVDFTPIWAGASIGAVIGSFFSYWLGWRYGDRMLKIWPLRDHPHLVQRGTNAFAKWGLLAVVIGHFFGPLRAVVFVLAGVSRMSPAGFAVVNVLGCVLCQHLSSASSRPTRSGWPPRRRPTRPTTSSAPSRRAGAAWSGRRSARRGRRSSTSTGRATAPSGARTGGCSGLNNIELITDRDRWT
jgi:membrane protein DedA with SNARE-associated domain